MSWRGQQILIVVVVTLTITTQTSHQIWFLHTQIEKRCSTTSKSSTHRIIIQIGKNLIYIHGILFCVLLFISRIRREYIYCYDYYRVSQYFNTQSLQLSSIYITSFIVYYLRVSKHSISIILNMYSTF